MHSEKPMLLVKNAVVFAKKCGRYSCAYLKLILLKYQKNRF